MTNKQLTELLTEKKNPLFYLHSGETNVLNFLKGCPILVHGTMFCIP